MIYHTVIKLSLGTTFSICCLFIIPCMAQDLFLDPQFDVQITDGVIYGTAPIDTPPGEVDLLLDLYEPVGACAPFIKPGFIIIHGGGFISGSRKDEPFVTLATEMAARGYTAVSIDYRLQDQEPIISEEFEPLKNALLGCGLNPLFARAFTAAIEDGTHAHRWMVAKAGLLGIDTHRIAVGGGSAGAITSLFMAYVLDDCNVTQLPEIGVVMDICGALYVFVNNMETGESPLFIAHGEEDDIVDFENAVALKERATLVNIPFEFHSLPGIGHEFDIFTVEVAPGVTVFDSVVPFFYEQLRLTDLVLEIVIQSLMEGMSAINNLDPSDLKNINHKKTLTKKMNAVLKMINTKSYVSARNKLLNDILKKMDGFALSGYPDKDDWIITKEGQDQVYPLILYTIDYLSDLINQNCTQGNAPFYEIRSRFELYGWCDITPF